MTESVDASPNESNGLPVELAEIFQAPSALYRHNLLKEFTRTNPSNGLGHIYLGLSYLQNRFDPTLMLPLNIMVFGGPSHAPREMVKEHMERAEEHFRRAMEVDPSLNDQANVNLACVKVFANRYGPAVLFIEELLKKPQDEENESILKLDLGVAYRELGEYEMALSLFRSLTGSSLENVRRQIAITLLFQGDLENAKSEILTQLKRSNQEIDRMLLQAIIAELNGSVSLAISYYNDIAARCRFDGANQILGIDAAMRAAKLGNNKTWKLTDYCDELTY